MVRARCGALGPGKNTRETVVFFFSVPRLLLLRGARAVRARCVHPPWELYVFDEWLYCVRLFFLIRTHRQSWARMAC